MNLSNDQATELILIRVKNFAKRASKDETCRLMLYGIVVDLCLHNGLENADLLMQIVKIASDIENSDLGHELYNIAFCLGVLGHGL